MENISEIKQLKESLAQSDKVVIFWVNVADTQSREIVKLKKQLGEVYDKRKQG